MTLEFSLRRRAMQARCLAALWLGLATTILLGTYISLPFVAGKTLAYVSQVEAQTPFANDVTDTSKSSSKLISHAQIFAMGTMVLGLCAVSFACFLLGRSAFVEIELSARFAGLADALCIAGESFEELEKAANLLMPTAKYLSVPEIFSAKDLKSVADTVKQLR